MLQRDSRTSIKLAFVFFTFIAAAAANASLLDCTTSLGLELVSSTECSPAESVVNEAPDSALKDAIPATRVNAALAAFQIDQTRHTDAMSNSVPLLVLIGALLAVLLVRAKRFNTK